MPLQVRTLDDASAPAWDAFVDAMPEGTFFHRAAWARVIRDGLRPPHLLRLRRARRRHHRRAAPGAGEDAAVRQHAGVQSVLRLRRLARGRRRQRRRAWKRTPRRCCAAPAPARSSSATAIPAADGSEWVGRPDLYVTFRKPIEADHERNMKAIPRKQRAMVRKGIQYGLTSVCHRDTAVLHRAYAESVRNLGTPVFSRRYFDILLDAVRRCRRHRDRAGRWPADRRR